MWIFWVRNNDMSFDLRRLYKYWICLSLFLADDVKHPHFFLYCISFFYRKQHSYATHLNVRMRSANKMKKKTHKTEMHILNYIFIQHVLKKFNYKWVYDTKSLQNFVKCIHNQFQSNDLVHNNLCLCWFFKFKY